MCEPITIMTIAGLAVSAGGQIAQANAQNAIARQNAAIEENAARDALATGLVEAEGVAITAGKALGAQKARFGASGVTVNSGSPLEAIADSALFGELDKQTTQANAARAAWGYRAAAATSLQEGKLAQRAGWFQAGSTMLVGGASAYGDYLRLNPPTPKPAPKPTP